MDLVLRTAADAGLYVLARPGPYINAEVNAGGFPGWLTRTAAVARTDDPVYLGYADEWLTAINAIVARHQVTDGGGTVLLYQIENEYASYLTSPTGRNYLAHLYAKARADGITVPIYHNDKGRNGDWVPGSFPAPDGNYLYAFDGYPSATGTPPDWGYYGPGGARGGSTASRCPRRSSTPPTTTARRSARPASSPARSRPCRNWASSCRPSRTSRRSTRPRR
jgi:beta-galactosidase GanA